MASPLEIAANDVSLKPIPPASPTDPRVVMAEEIALAGRLGVASDCRLRTEIQRITRAAVDAIGGRRLRIALEGSINPFPNPISINQVISVPALANTNLVTIQRQHLSLVGFLAEVGAVQDAVLGEVTFTYRESNVPPTQVQIKSATKENARRYRAFWVLVLSSLPFSSADFLDLLVNQVDGSQTFTVTNKDEGGFSQGVYQVYAVDPNLKLGASYRVELESDAFTSIMPIAEIIRRQNYESEGYVWGSGGEQPLENRFNIVDRVPSSLLGNEDSARSIADAAFYRITRGIGSGIMRRTVLNFLSGGSPIPNSATPGVIAASPNGSVCLANDHRASFTNEGRILLNTSRLVQATTDTSGNPIVTISLNSNSPTGMRFSEKVEDHKVFNAATGTDETRFGTFSGIGSTTLTWVGNNSSIIPGGMACVQPGVINPAGSGLSVPFNELEVVYLNNAIADGFMAANDLTQYVDLPRGYVAVFGTERMALHYIYKQVSLQANGNGVIVAPSNGVFAFVNGIAGRINRPVVTGLTPNSTHKALIYYPLRSTDVFQVQVVYPEYQGTGTQEPGWLNGAEIISQPQFVAHTLCAGGSAFWGDSTLRMIPCSEHYPSPGSQKVASYSLNGPIWLEGEAYPGTVPFRYLSPNLIAAKNLTVPVIGQQIGITPAPTSSGRSLQGRMTANGLPCGFRTPKLNGGIPYQAVIYFLAEKERQRRLVIVTANTFGGEDVNIASDMAVGIDTFKV